MPHFGPAGRGDAFAALGYKKTEQVPAYLAHFGLDTFEVQCGRGVRVNAGTAATLKAENREGKILYSIHAPYYISMASEDEEKREKSIDYLLQSAQAVALFGGGRVIFHCGGVGKFSRDKAMALTVDVLARAREALDTAGYEAVALCPETMGRVNQLGTLEEVLELCKADRRHIPCVDFGHLNALAQGGYNSRAAFEKAAYAIADALGDVRARNFHVHFSKIEYTKAGEKRHLTFEDAQFGPPFEPFIETCAELGLAPVVICESSGTQAEDAQAMQLYYHEYIKHNNIQRG